MYRAINENMLIDVDIVNLMEDYTSIQVDIDETKIKAAALAAQRHFIKPIIGKENLNRCIEPQDESDDALKELIIIPWCYYTYYNCLTMFQGTFTDSGYIVEGDAETDAIAKNQANQIKAFGDSDMQEVLEFLKEENPEDESVSEDLVPRIRVIGGKETRSSN